LVFDLLVENGRLVSEGGIVEANLAIKDGQVAAVLAPGATVEARMRLDATGKFVMPGAIDPHTHGGHGDPDRETLLNASMAAAAGGITTILDQPLSNPSTVTIAAFEKKLAEGSKSCVVDFGIWGGLIPGHLQNLKAMYDAGAQAFKSFMCRCSNYPMTDDGTLLKGMRVIGDLGGLVAVHAENDTLIAQLVEDYARKGKRDVEAFLGSHPAYTELEAILRFIFIAEQAPRCRAHIVHMSIPEGAAAVAQAKAEGLNISVETCPQYLGLTEDDLRRVGGIAKCDPPVRSREAVDELWEFVIDGTIDILASDHSPHPFDKKVVPEAEFWKAGEGVTGLQTMVPVALTEGVHKRGMSLSRLAAISSTNVAQRFGLYPRKGTLGVGSDADFYLLDLDREWVCRAQDMHYLNKHTPFDGRTFRGLIEKTFVRGKLVSDQGAIVAGPGSGRFVPMRMN